MKARRPKAVRVRWTMAARVDAEYRCCHCGCDVQKVTRSATNKTSQSLTICRWQTYNTI